MRWTRGLDLLLMVLPLAGCTLPDPAPAGGPILMDPVDWAGSADPHDAAEPAARRSAAGPSKGRAEEALPSQPVGAPCVPCLP